MNYVEISRILEKINRDKPDTFKYNIADVYEWVWEAISFIGAEKAYGRTTLSIELDNNMCIVPSNISDVRTIYTYEGEAMIETRNRFETNVLNGYQYILNGRTLTTNYTGKAVNIEAFIFPTDEDNKPLVPDNVYVIEAVVSYVIYRLAKREWIKNNVAGQVYKDLEQGWLFHAEAAKNKLVMPTVDEMRELNELHDISSGVNKVMRGRNVDDYNLNRYVV